MAFDLGGTIDAAAQEWNLDPALLHAVSQTESGQQASGPDSSAGAIGPLQVMPGTAADMGATNPRDPTQNVYAGAKYLSGLLDKYQEPQLAVAAYNAGPQRVDDYLAGKASLPAETTAYVPKVARAYATIAGASGQSSASRPAGSYDVAAADTGSMSDANPSPLAPPSSSSGGSGNTASAGSGAVDPFSQLLTAAGGTASAAAPAASSAAAPANTSGQVGASSTGDPFSDLMTAAGKADSAPPAAFSPATAASGAGTTSATPGGLATAAQGGIMGAVRSGLSTIGAGINTGAEGIANTAMRGAAYVDSKVPALANLDRSAGLDPQAGTQDLDQSIQQADQAHAGSLLYNAGKIGTDLAFALPVTAGLGAAAGVAGEALGVPTVANALAGSSPIVRAAGALTRNALAGSAQGVVASGLNDGSSTAPLGQQLRDGAEFGAVLGAGVPLAVGAARGAIGNALGGTISPEAAALAQTARDTYGIPLQAGQISSSPFVRFLGSQLEKLPLSGAGPASDAQRTAMTTAIASTFGENADSITPAVMSAARTRLGNTFNTLAGQINVRADPQMISDLGDITTRAQSVLNSDQQGIVGRQLMNLVDKVQQGNGTLPGSVYQNLIAKGGALDDAMNSGNPGVKLYAGQIRDVLDDAMQRSAPSNLAQQLAEARFQYKNLKTIEPLVPQAQGQDGNISPLRLLQAVRNNFSDMAYSGAGPLGELAAIGQRFMKAPPDSGTATRNMIMGGLSALTPAGLATVAHEPIGVMGAALGTLGTVAAGRAAGAYLRSPMLANRLISNGLAGNPTSSVVNALAGNAGVLGGVGPYADPTGNALTAGR